MAGIMVLEWALSQRKTTTGARFYGDAEFQFQERSPDWVMAATLPTTSVSCDHRRPPNGPTHFFVSDGENQEQELTPHGAPGAHAVCGGLLCDS